MPTALTQAEAIARARLIHISSYSLTLNLTADPVRVRSEIKFGCEQPGAGTFADLDVTALHLVTLNGEPLDPRSVVAGRLPLPGLMADNTLVVDAEVGYLRAGRGLVSFTDPADGRQYVLANCFPTAAPSVFCCFDQPDLRADLTLAITAPAGWQCVANGAVLERPADGSTGLWRFAAVPAAKPYDFTLCAGPYVAAPAQESAETASGVQLTVSCRPALAGLPGLARIAAIVDRSIAFYQELLNVACPYDKLDIVFVPELGPVAMQDPGIMYVSEPLLQRAADTGDTFVAEVLAHEAAHLWFGCLVEGRWWDDDWLAEAMASYLSYRALAESFGLDSSWAEFAMSGKASAYQADSLPSRVPVSSPVATAADALTSPAAIRYNKGASVIRQLAALIGDRAMRAGLADYLGRYAWSSASVEDIVDCWSAASGRDLGGWASQWLKLSGVNTLRPELVTDPDGSITSAAIRQDPPPGNGELRTHRIAVGVYSRIASALARERQIDVEVSGARTLLPELVGRQRPAAIIINDADLAFAKIRFDDVSLRALAGVAFELPDPLTEAVCWNAAWDMVQTAELSAADFVGLAARRFGGGRSPAGAEYLLERAVRAADYYADPRRRPELRQQLASACLAAANRAEPASRLQRVVAAAFAAAAETSGQLDLLRAWLGGMTLPDRLVLDFALRARILATLAARDLATEDDLTAYADADPVSGDTQVATCRARRPTEVAKRAAWAAALGPGQPPRLALAHANGIWVPGQEGLAHEFRERYFSEALPAARLLEARTAQRLARALYPATLADEATLMATAAELRRITPSDAVRAVLLEQRAILQQVITARAAVSNAEL